MADAEDTRELVAAVDRATDGRVVIPEDPSYDRLRRVWNARIDRRPAAIVQPTSVDDVVATIEVTAGTDMPVVARGGGHHVSGSAVLDGGMTLDLAELDAVTVNPDTTRVTVEGGATWGQVDEATRPHGLAAVGGQDPNIGVAGLTLGGGVGWLSRAYGLAADNLVEAEVVTADAEVVTASADTNPDLFWGLRGAGGSLGIVTSFTFELHQVDRVLAGSLVYPIERASVALRGYRNLVASSPPTLRPLFGLFDLPSTSPLADRVPTTRVAIIIVCAIDPVADAIPPLDRLRSETEPLVDSVTERSYHAFQRAGESDPHARTGLRSRYLPELTDDAIEAIADLGTAVPSAGATVFVSPRADAEIAVPTHATAYPHRTPCHHVLIEARWDDPRQDAIHDRWVQDGATALADHTTGIGSLNFVDRDEPDAQARRTLGPNLERLEAVKARWDPTDRFGGHATQRWG